MIVPPTPPPACRHDTAVRASGALDVERVRHPGQPRAPALPHLAPSTIRNYRHYVACFLAWWDACRPGEGLAPVRARHLADHLVTEAGRGLAPSTIYAEVNGLRVFFAWLVVEKHLSADPSATLSPPRRNPNHVDVYSPVEASTILAHTCGLTDVRGRQRHAIVATFRYTGARAGEVSGLRLDRVDVPGRRLEVLGKGSRHRTIALTTQLASVLDTFLREVRPELPETPYLFVNTHLFVPDPEKRCSISALEREVRIAMRAPAYPDATTRTGGATRSPPNSSARESASPKCRAPPRPPQHGIDDALHPPPRRRRPRLPRRGVRPPETRW